MFFMQSQDYAKDSLTPIEVEDTIAPTPSPTTNAPTLEPTQTPEPTEEPSPTPKLGQITLEDENSNLRVRGGPSLSHDTIGIILNNLVVEVLNISETWVEIKFDGRSGYLSADYVTIKEGLSLSEKEIYYAHIPHDDKEKIFPMPKTYDPNSKFYEGIDQDRNGEIDHVKAQLINNLVDVKKYLPDVPVYQIFGTDENFTGKILYKKEVVLLQNDTLKNLIKAQEKFLADGYSIKIYDAYRPQSVQFILFDFVGGNSRYIANPNSGSNHNRGAAVDITLVDTKTLEEIEMPSKMHVFDETAYRTHKDMTDAARKNMDYMTNVMRSCGFTSYTYEWWHFNDKDAKYQYMVTDIDFEKVFMVREQ